MEKFDFEIYQSGVFIAKRFLARSFATSETYRISSDDELLIRIGK